MKALHRACREARRGETAFYLFGSQELFGLQFYLSGRLTRVAEEPIPAWARRSLDSICHEMIASPEHDTYVFIAADPRSGDTLRKRFEDLGLRCEITGSGSRYVLFACRAPSPSSNLAAATRRGEFRGGIQSSFR